jgi:hypothetical protein
MDTPSPFRSTTAFASRRQTRPVVERSVFVIASAGALRVALPVEWVERVVREPGAHETLRYGDRLLPVHELAACLGVEAVAPAAADARLLVLRRLRAADQLFAVRVHAVHEVFAVETVLVLPVTTATEQAPQHAVVRGVFPRLNQQVWVLDLARLPEPS